MYEPDDYFYEPNEFEQQVDEFKASLLNAVRDEHKAEMERLRKENAELQPIKERMEDIERERVREKQEVDRAKADAMKEAKKLRLGELLKDYQHVIYTVDDKRVYPKKCDKCDDERKLEYITPLGRTAKEYCTCSEFFKEYFLREIKATSIDHYSPEDGLVTSYFDNERDEKVRSYNIYSEGEEFKANNYYTYFLRKEDAQRYCDWLTAKEAEKKTGEGR